MLIDCKSFAQEWLVNLKHQRAELSRAPRLGVVLVGSNPASKRYVGAKQKTAHEMAIAVTVSEAPVTATTEDVVALVTSLADQVDGMLVQLPLPKQIDSTKVLNAVPSEKDIDGLGEISLAALVRGKEKYLPATVRGIVYLLQKLEIKIDGARVLIVGAGQLVGRPLALALTNRGASVTVADKGENDLAALSKHADVLVSATGQIGLIGAREVHAGQVVIDAGFNVQNGHSIGDVDTEAVSKVGAFVTPVPGGVGRFTVLALIANLLEAMLGSKSTPK